MLRKYVSVTLIPLMLWFSGCASMPPNALAGAVAAERARFDAMGRGDVDALAQLFADDLVFCHSFGRCDTKEEYLKQMRGIAKPTTVTINNLQPRQVGGVVLINGDVVFNANMTEPPSQMKLKYTDVWVHKDGRWQLTAWQSTRLP